MAGIHQELWTLDPATGAVRGGWRARPTRGWSTGRSAQAWFAQPSGLAVDGDRLWVADFGDLVACASSRLTVSAARSAPRSARGSSTSGSATAPPTQALFRRPLGVTRLPDGSVAVCDTYNGAIRRYDPSVGPRRDAGERPGRAERRPTWTESDLVVVETNAHRLTRVPLGAAATARPRGSATPRSAPSPTSAHCSTCSWPSPHRRGQKVDDRFGPRPSSSSRRRRRRCCARATGAAPTCTRALVLDPAVGEGVLHVAARAASCDVDGGENAACHIHQQDWGVPIRVAPGADGVLRLPLGDPG